MTSDTLDQAVLGVVGGGTALASHLVKAGSRLAINSSPEPVTNIVASLAEDVAVLGVVWFAIEHPRAAAAIAGGAPGGRPGAAVLRREAGPPRLAPVEEGPVAATRSRPPRAGSSSSVAASAAWPRPPGWPSSATR